MKAAITGGAGFIGSHLIRGLLAQGHAVSVIDDLSTGHATRLDAFRDRISVHVATIGDRDALETTLDGCEVVFHCAAIASVARSLVEPRLTNDVNVGGTIDVVLAAAQTGVRRVILAGSSAVYGLTETIPSTERQRADPSSPYGASKLAAEHYLHTLGQLHDVQTVVLRYFNVYGPGQDPNAEYAAVIPKFITAVLEGRRPTINGTDDISRDFVFVDDVVEANLRAADEGVVSGLTCNIAGGVRTSLRTLLREIAAAVGHDVEPEFGPARPGDIRHSQADISLAREALGYEPQVALAAGIARTVDWFREGSAPATEANGT
jgi:UDP-glucose 4-epimerase